MYLTANILGNYNWQSLVQGHATLIFFKMERTRAYSNKDLCG